MEKFYKKVAALYDSKRDDLNKYLAYDGIIHHHNGIFRRAPGKKTPPEDEIRKMLHESETALSRLAIAALSPEKGESILDAGCGRGGNAILMASGKKGVKIAGINISSYQLSAAARLIKKKKLSGKIKLFKMSMEATRFAENSFDKILACESTEHMRLDKFFSEAARLAVPGARLAVVAWTRNGNSPLSVRYASAIDRKYATRMHEKGEYSAYAEKNGWKKKKTKDLTRMTVNYWKLRGKSSAKTGTEKLMEEAFGKRALFYLLYVYELVK